MSRICNAVIAVSEDIMHFLKYIIVTNINVIYGFGTTSAGLLSPSIIMITKRLLVLSVEAT